jgi:hypothetical protein
MTFRKFLWELRQQSTVCGYKKETNLILSIESYDTSLVRTYYGLTRFDDTGRSFYLSFAVRIHLGIDRVNTNLKFVCNEK